MGNYAKQRAKIQKDQAQKNTGEKLRKNEIAARAADAENRKVRQQLKSEEQAELLKKSKEKVETKTPRSLNLLDNLNKKQKAQEQQVAKLLENQMRGYYEETIELLTEAAEAGDVEAQVNLGLMYCRGEGVEQNFKEALDWFKKAAEAGDVEAQYNLGVMYHEGIGVAKDYKKAVKWNKKAAEAGDVEAQYNLGYMYYNGEGVKRDYTEAVKWYEKAAKIGFVGAQNNLGLMYDRGEGVIQDYKKAADWYRKAADAGCLNAQANLGLTYYRGEGVAQDYEQAIKYFEKAVDNGWFSIISRICDIKREQQKPHEDLIEYLEGRKGKTLNSVGKYICFIELSKEYRNMYHEELIKRNKIMNLNDSKFLIKAKEALDNAKSQNLSEEVKRSLDLYKEVELLSRSIERKKEIIKNFDDYLRCIKKYDKDGNSRYHNLLPSDSNESKEINTIVFNYLQASNSTEDLREYLEKPKKLIIKALKGGILSLEKPKELFTLSNPSQLQIAFKNLLNNINIDQEKVSNIIDSENPDGLIDDSNLTTIRQFISNHTSVSKFNEFTTNLSTTMEDFIKKITDRKTYFNLVIKKKLVDSILALDEDSKIEFLKVNFSNNKLLVELSSNSNEKIINSLKNKLNYNFILENIDKSITINPNNLEIENLDDILNAVNPKTNQKFIAEDVVNEIQNACNEIKLIGVDQSKGSKEKDKASDLGRAYNRLYLPNFGEKNEKSNSCLQVNPALITLSKMYNPNMSKKEIKHKIQDLYTEVKYYTDIVRNPAFHDGKLPKEVYEEGLSVALLQKGSIFDLMEELFGGVIKDLREQEKDNQETNEKGKKRESNNQGKTDDSNNREIGG